jgi:hypothetical protein
MQLYAPAVSLLGSAYGQVRTGLWKNKTIPQPSVEMHLSANILLLTDRIIQIRKQIQIEVNNLYVYVVQ